MYDMHFWHSVWYLKQKQFETMKKIILITTLLLILGTCVATAQVKKWTLKDCIDYAVTNNIGLQRQRLLTESAQANYLKSKMDILPSLNFESDGNMGFGRSIDPVTNLITFKQNISNSYALSSNLELFGGLSTLNTVAANRFMLKAGLEAEKVARNTLVVEILGQYYKALYARGLEEVSKMQLDDSEKQLFRITKMVEIGKEALSKQLEMQSRVSSGRLDYTVAKNSTNQAVTILRQMLQIDPGNEFDLLLPNLDSMIVTEGFYKADSVYNIASEVLPRLKAVEYELKSYKKQYAASKGYISPRLTAGGVIYTGFYKVMNESGIDQSSFNSQLKNNNSQSISLRLQIPIFNNYTTGRNIKMARIKRDDAALRLEQEKNNLYSDIENACLEYNRGKDEFRAAESNLMYNRQSFAAVEKKFETGLVDVTDYSAAQTNLLKAEAEALRTRLEVMVRDLAIHLYSTGEYENLINN
jgi:outer membrane protein